LIEVRGTAAIVGKGLLAGAAGTVAGFVVERLARRD
jgi:hypothetical protein